MFDYPFAVEQFFGKDLHHPRTPLQCYIN